MTEEVSKLFAMLKQKAGESRYGEDAFVFVRDGLSFAAEHVHGPETDEHIALQKFLLENDLDWSDLATRYLHDELPDELVAAVDAAGGPEKLNRHISGRQLCWCLRDFALERWGMLARTVLESWGIRRTRDFGHIVFAFIECDLMRKQDGDTIDDFDEVFDFAEAFDAPFQIQEEDETEDADESE